MLPCGSNLGTQNGFWCSCVGDNPISLLCTEHKRFWQSLAWRHGQREDKSFEDKWSPVLRAILTPEWQHPNPTPLPRLSPGQPGLCPTSQMGWQAPHLQVKHSPFGSSQLMTEGRGYSRQMGHLSGASHLTRTGGIGEGRGLLRDWPGSAGVQMSHWAKSSLWGTSNKIQHPAHGQFEFIPFHRKVRWVGEGRFWPCPPHPYSWVSPKRRASCSSQACSRP